MVAQRQPNGVSHGDAPISSKLLSRSERESIMKPYLPAPPQKDAVTGGRPGRFHHKSRLRPAIRNLIHHLIFFLVHAVFSFYIRLRQTCHAIVGRVFAVLYHHHRTPELIKKDVKKLSKSPKHLSVVLDLPPKGERKDGLEALINDACEIAAWTGSAGIPMLSIYERSGEIGSQPSEHSVDQLTSRP